MHCNAAPRARGLALWLISILQLATPLDSRNHDNTAPNLPALAACSPRAAQPAAAAVEHQLRRLVSRGSVTSLLECRVYIEAGPQQARAPSPLCDEFILISQSTPTPRPGAYRRIGSLETAVQQATHLTSCHAGPGSWSTLRATLSTHTEYSMQRSTQHAAHNSMLCTQHRLTLPRYRPRVHAHIAAHTTRDKRSRGPRYDRRSSVPTAAHRTGHPETN